MSIVRWGVLSTAKIAREKVVPALQAADNGAVVALAGRDAEHTRAVADRLGVPRAHPSYEALLADDEVDAVYIPLPNHLHAEWTIRAAAAGKHVLCEKPLALTAAQAAEMVDACAGAGVILMEAFMYRLHPSWQRAVELVREGRIGDVVAVDSWFSYHNDDPANIRNIAAYGGGALLDIGCYAVNLSRLLFGGEPTAVGATMRRDATSGVDILTAAVLDFDDGVATFGCGTRSEPDQYVHVHGTAGRLSIEIPFNIPPDRPTRVHLTAGGTPPVAPATETLEFAPADQYRIQAERFGAAVLGQEPVPIPPADAVANMAVIDRIVAAAG